jgi:hypothetical protein
MDLFYFVEFRHFETNLDFLANRLALKEAWDYSDPEKEFNEGNLAAEFHYPILRNYLEHTYRKIKAEGKIIYTADAEFACFNTGLVTQNLEEIFFLCQKNRLPGNVPYFFKAFIKKSDPDFLRLFSAVQPQPANYFDRPDLLLFNPRKEIIIDVEHIIQDNKRRFPGHLKTASDREVSKHLTGAIDEICKRVKINYKLAIPQYYNNTFQLLLPLYLVDDKKPDLAIVVERVNDQVYSAATCLTIGMAYNNARLIVCPHSEWLQP